MRFAPLCFACLLSIARPAPGAAQAPARDRPDPTGTAVIRGRVMLAGSDQPLGRVDVRASSPVLKTARAAKTDASGRYEIGNLPAGRYVVSAVKTNFVTAAFGQKRPEGPGKPFELADGQIATNVDFAMARAGVITGRVLDEFGDPFPDIQVQVVRYRYVDGQRRVLPNGFGTSNDLGEFRLFGLTPGTYYVSATYRPFGYGGETEDRSGYAPTYFPGTGNIAEAQRITIEPGQVVSGITIPLQPVHTARVSGVALDSTGKPLAGTIVMLTSRDGMPGLLTRSFTVKPDGSFSIGGVPPGEYVLRTADGPARTTVYAAASITVTGGDVNGVQLVGMPRATLTGRVVFDSAAAPPRSSTVRISTVRPDPVMAGGGTAVAKDDFSFELKTNHGRATIVASIVPAGDWRLKRVMLNGVDITDSGLDIPPNAAIAGLVVEITDRFGELSGTVSNASGELERDCWVIAFAQDPRRWPSPTRYVVSSRPGQDERFHVRLPAGQYLVAAVSNIEPGEWQDPEVLARLRDRAVAFSIGDGERKTVELRVVESR